MDLSPAHLKPTFDPNAARIGDLRGILLEHDVPYASNAKKSDLVRAYDTHIRPRAAILLAQRRAVQPSGHGIIDARNGGLLVVPEPRPFAVASKAKPGRSRSLIIPDTEAEDELDTNQVRIEVDEEVFVPLHPPKPPPAAVLRRLGRKARDPIPESDAMDIDPPEPVTVAPAKRSRKTAVKMEDDVAPVVASTSAPTPRARARTSKVAQIKREASDEDIKVGAMFKP